MRTQNFKPFKINFFIHQFKRFLVLTHHTLLHLWCRWDRRACCPGWGTSSGPSPPGWGLHIWDLCWPPDVWIYHNLQDYSNFLNFFSLFNLVSDISQPAKYFRNRNLWPRTLKIFLCKIPAFSYIRWIRSVWSGMSGKVVRIVRNSRRDKIDITLSRNVQIIYIQE